MPFRVIPQLDSYPQVVHLVQTPLGKVLLFTLFAFLLSCFSGYWLEMTVILTMIDLFPRNRRALLGVGALWFALLHPSSWQNTTFIRKVGAIQGIEDGELLLLQALTVVLLLFTWGLLYRRLFRAPQLRFHKRPILTLLLMFGTLVLGASYAPPVGIWQVLFWMVVTTIGAYFWYFCYTLLDQDSKDSDPYKMQIGTYHPFWAVAYPTNTPFVKGAAYLRKIEARDSTELAITQLKGLKLLLWAIVLNVVLAVCASITHGGATSGTGVLHSALKLTSHLSLGIPTFDEAFARSVERRPLAWYICWLSLLASFLETLLRLSIGGHQIIACCRMAGFRALRNTYRPLQAKTVAEFWNRFYFYFKELLVDVFFYPTYVRYFKGRRRLRIFTATLSAAFVGNTLFHFIDSIDYVADLGLRKAVLGFHVYAFYCLVLAVGIGISQLRKRRSGSASVNWFRRTVVPTFCVVGFYCVLRIFDYPGRTYPITEHFRFCANLVAFWR